MAQTSVGIPVNARDRAIAFVIATYLTSGMLGLMFHLAGFHLAGSQALVLGAVYMAVPLVVALLLQPVVVKQPIREGLALHAKPNRFFVVALLLPLLVASLSLGVALLLPGVHYAGFDGLLSRGADTLTAEQRDAARVAFNAIPIPPLLFILMKAAAAGPTLNALVALGEEAGWRGFLYQSLRGSFYRVSLVTGLVWGVWHIPLVLMGLNTVGSTGLSIVTTIAFTMLWAPLFTYVRQRSQSVIASSIMHGTVNASASASMLAAGSAVLVGPTAVAALLALVVANVALFLYDTRVAKDSLIRATDVHVEATTAA